MINNTKVVYLWYIKKVATATKTFNLYITSRKSI